MNNPENSLVPLEQAEHIAAIALREIKTELITPEICEWAITSALQGVSALSIRQQALEAQAIALSKRVDQVEGKVYEQDRRITMLEAEQRAQDKIVGFLQGQTQQAQNLALDTAKDSNKKHHLWIHDPAGMVLACVAGLLAISMLFSLFASIRVVQTPVRERQEVRP